MQTLNSETFGQGTLISRRSKILENVLKNVCAPMDS